MPKPLAEEKGAQIRELRAKGLSSALIGAEIGLHKSAVIRYINKHNLGSCVPVKKNIQTRPIPDDFAEMAAASNYKQLAAHYKASPNTVNRWIKESGAVALNTTPQKIKPPADLAARVVGLNYTEAARELGVCTSVARRFMQEAGIDPAPVKRTTTHLPKLPDFQRTDDRYQRDMSIVGQAADHLKRISAVWRCNERGSPDPAGKLWRRGSAILTDEELLERARFKGFEPVFV